MFRQYIDLKEHLGKKYTAGYEQTNDCITFKQFSQTIYLLHCSNWRFY